MLVNGSTTNADVCYSISFERGQKNEVSMLLGNKSIRRIFSLPATAGRRIDGLCVIIIMALMASASWGAAQSAGAKAADDLVPNRGFEQSAPSAGGVSTAPGWNPYGTGYAVVSDQHREGGQSICCKISQPNITSGAFCTLVIGQTKVQPIVISGWSKSNSVDGEADPDYSIYADITYADGSSLWGQNMPFDVGTHSWERRRLIVLPSEPIRSINLYALFRNHQGTVWFDDFSATTSAPDSLFDGQIITPPSLTGGRKSGWFIRDVGDDSPITALAAHGTTLGIQSSISHSAAAGGAAVLTIRNKSAVDRALTVYYVQRFDKPNTVWYDNIRQCRPAIGGGEFSNLTQVSVGATGTLSIYPFGCVTGTGAGEALAVPPQYEPRVARIIYNATYRLLFAAFDIALQPVQSHSKHVSATVGVASFAVNPTWGFRDAASRFYEKFPDAFIVRSHVNGIWMPFTDPATVQNASSFHFGYHEGDNSVAADRASGILSFHYVEPMTYWMAMSPETPRTYDAACAYVQRLAHQAPDPVARREAQAVLTSGSEDENGKFNVSFRDAPWCNGAVWTLDPNPALPHADGEWTKAMLNQIGSAGSSETLSPSGEYLDSLEMMADVLDYRPESLNAATLPLTFATDVNKPVVPTWFSVYEAADTLARSLHKQHKLIMANTVPWRFGAFTSLLDVMGTETNMFDSDGNWAPESDAVMDLRRTLSFRKPYLLLLNTDFAKVSYTGMSLYFQRCLFYDIYPSMFSADASDAPYWKDPTLYNRDRPLFEQYIPALKTLSSAGWEPVTDAVSNNSNVWVERFGGQLFTVLNPQSTLTVTTISIDVDSLYPSYHARQQRYIVWNVVSHQKVCILSAVNHFSVPLSLQPSQTVVLRLLQQPRKLG